MAVITNLLSLIAAAAAVPLLTPTAFHEQLTAIVNAQQTMVDVVSHMDPKSDKHLCEARLDAAFHAIHGKIEENVLALHNTDKMTQADYVPISWHIGQHWYLSTQRQVEAVIRKSKDLKHVGVDHAMEKHIEHWEQDVREWTQVFCQKAPVDFTPCEKNTKALTDEIHRAERAYD